jgi:hypothetical protein
MAWRSPLQVSGTRWHSRYLHNPGWGNLIFPNQRLVLPIPVDICNGSTEFFSASANPKPRAHSQILVVSSGPNAGRSLGYVGHELIVNSRQPVLDGARELLTLGYDPGMPYNMRLANSATFSFITTTIGHVAGLGVNDTRATRFQKFERSRR